MPQDGHSSRPGSIDAPHAGHDGIGDSDLQWSRGRLGTATETITATVADTDMDMDTVMVTDTATVSAPVPTDHQQHPTAADIALRSTIAGKPAALSAVSPTITP